MSEQIGWTYHANCNGDVWYYEIECTPNEFSFARMWVILDVFGTEYFYWQKKSHKEIRIKIKGD